MDRIKLTKPAPTQLEPDGYAFTAWGWVVYILVVWGLPIGVILLWRPWRG